MEHVTVIFPPDREDRVDAAISAVTSGETTFRPSRDAGLLSRWYDVAGKDELAALTKAVDDLDDAEVRYTLTD